MTGIIWWMWNTRHAALNQARAMMKSDRTDIPDDLRWQAVLARQSIASAGFVYAVRTTGVYCNPGCRSRRPLRDNVEFYDTPAAAAAAGYRPCKRCRPDRAATPPDDAVARACALIAAADQMPPLVELSAAVGLSPFHFHRRFKQALGLTPKAYIDAERARRLRIGLGRGSSVTAAVYDAGYGSSSRFYETAQARLGMSPTQYLKGGEGIAIRYAAGRCSLGAVLVAATDRGICAIELGDDSAAALDSLRSRFPGARLSKAGEDFQSLVARAIAAVEQPEQAANLPLDVQGTAFQEQVWRALRDIPSGATETYADVARRLGRPSSTRAVATAIAANPIAVLVPCHRVVRTDGGLGGYRWGLDRKKRLLAREASAIQKPRK